MGIVNINYSHICLIITINVIADRKMAFHFRIADDVYILTAKSCLHFFLRQHGHVFILTAFFLHTYHHDILRSHITICHKPFLSKRLIRLRINGDIWLHICRSRNIFRHDLRSYQLGKVVSLIGSHILPFITRICIIQATMPLEHATRPHFGTGSLKSLTK